jgi:hypothetical protein
MTEWRSALQVELPVPGFAAPLAAVRLAAARMVAGPAVAEVPLVVERNRMDRAPAAQLQVTPNKELRAAHISLSCKPVIPRF